MPANEIKPDESRIERRILATEDVEMRVTDGDKPKITGYGAKFGKWSLDLGGFTEKIRKGAFDEALENSDVRALKNHDPNLLLGRTSSGTMRLSGNSVGLRFEVDVPDTVTGRDTVTEIRRGDLSGCSFSFTTAEDDWKYNEDGTVERTIIKVGKLYDVGPVTYPAYPDTTVAARSLDAFKDSTVVPEKRETPASPDEDPPDRIDDEQMQLRRRGYRKAGRILMRNAEYLPAAGDPAAAIEK